MQETYHLEITIMKSLCAKKGFYLFILSKNFFDKGARVGLFPRGKNKVNLFI